MKSKKYYYAYGVIETEEPKTCLSGLQENMSVIPYRDLALVFSEVANHSLQLTKENALAHHQIIAQIMKRQTIIPFSFGTLFNKKSEMTGLLTAAYGEIKKTLEQLYGKLELGLKVIWKKEALAIKLERDYEDLKRFKEEILSLPPDSVYGPAILLGQRVEAVMKEIQSECQEQIYSPLQAIALDARLNKLLNERMVLNAAFLVSRDQETRFDAMVNELYEQYQEQLNFMYSGPWPPYNFINLKLDRHVIGRG
ncbi:MAG: GvpL/GvpF family gas vesicle protein [Thermacetogeniaceae bacterium]